MNLRHLRTFVTVAEAGGIHRAVARLNLSQPAASRQIQQLEAELGVPLFDRIGRRVQLTSEGQHRRNRMLRADPSALQHPDAASVCSGSESVFQANWPRGSFTP
jgi:LysR family transcriptional regulator, cyn operon transcriptional activator